MKTRTIEDFLFYIQQINHFDSWELSMFTDICRTQKVNKGDVLLHIGEMAQKFYFVNKGCLRTFYINQLGTEFTRCLAIEKSFCWALPGFLNNLPSTEGIEALCDSELVVINKADFDLMVQKSIHFSAAYQKGLEQLCISYAMRMESFLTMNAKERYENLLSKNPEIVQKVSNKIVASYLGITQESLSRLKKRG